MTDEHVTVGAERLAALEALALAVRNFFAVERDWDTIHGFALYPLCEASQRVEATAQTEESSQ